MERKFYAAPSMSCNLFIFIVLGDLSVSLICRTRCRFRDQVFGFGHPTTAFSMRAPGVGIRSTTELDGWLTAIVADPLTGGAPWHRFFAASLEPSL